MNIIRQVLQGLLTVVLVLSVTSCSFLGSSGFISPEIALSDLRVTDATLLQTGLEIDVRIDNENPESLVVKAGSHRLYLNDLYIGKGFLVEPTTITPYGTAVSTVKLYISNATLLAKLLPIFESSSLAYRIDSSLVVNRGHFDRKVKLRSEDTFSFATPPDMSKLRGFL